MVAFTLTTIVEDTLGVAEIFGTSKPSAARVLHMLITQLGVGEGSETIEVFAQDVRLANAMTFFPVFSPSLRSVNKHVL